MKKIKYLFQLSILFSYAIVSTGCYTIINSPEDQVNFDETNNNEIVEESGSDTLNVDDNYTIINNYICSDESSCCGHDYCHTDSHSHSYHNCGGHCSLSFNWWTGTWVSYSCNYCHHWSCSGHHHGHFYGHGYFHHDGYYYGYHDGFYDGYWWGYNDGWWNSGGNDNDYSDGDDDPIERRENSYDRSETDDESGYQAITFEDRPPGDISNHDNADESNYIIYDKKNYSNSSSSIIINSIVNSKKSKNSRVEKRNNMALDIAQFLFTSYTNSNKLKSSSKSSSYKSKSSKKGKSSSYKSKSSKKSSSKSSKSSKKSSRSKGRSRL